MLTKFFSQANIQLVVVPKVAGLSNRKLLVVKSSPLGLCISCSTAHGNFDSLCGFTPPSLGFMSMSANTRVLVHRNSHSEQEAFVDQRRVCHPSTDVENQLTFSDSMCRTGDIRLTTTRSAIRRDRSSQNSAGTAVHAYAMRKLRRTTVRLLARLWAGTNFTRCDAQLVDRDDESLSHMVIMADPSANNPGQKAGESCMHAVHSLIYRVRSPRQQNYSQQSPHCRTRVCADKPHRPVPEVICALACHT